MQLKRRKRLIGYNGREETSDWPQLSEEVQVNPGGSHASRNIMWACVVLPGVYIYDSRAAGNL
jgi:hypothetical protein